MSTSESACGETTTKGVKDVCKKFLLKSDEILANKLQFEECFEHYKQNKISNQVNRINLEKSMPLIKSFQSEYQEFINKKMLERRNREIEEMDAAVAYEIQKAYIEELEREKAIQQIRDRELAKRLQEKEILIDIKSDVQTSKQPNVAIKMSQQISSHRVSSDRHFDPGDRSNTHRIQMEHDDFILAKILQEQEEKNLTASSKQPTRDTDVPDASSVQHGTHFGSDFMARIQKRFQSSSSSSQLQQQNISQAAKPPHPSKHYQSSVHLNKLSDFVDSPTNLSKNITVSCKHLNQLSIAANDHDNDNESSPRSNSSSSSSSNSCSGKSSESSKKERRNVAVKSGVSSQSHHHQHQLVAGKNKSLFENERSSSITSDHRKQVQKCAKSLVVVESSLLSLSPASSSSAAASKSSSTSSLVTSSSIESSANHHRTSHKNSSQLETEQQANKRRQAKTATATTSLLATAAAAAAANTASAVVETSPASNNKTSNIYFESTSSSCSSKKNSTSSTSSNKNIAIQTLTTTTTTTTTSIANNNQKSNKSSNINYRVDKKSRCEDICVRSRVDGPGYDESDHDNDNGDQKSKFGHNKLRLGEEIEKQYRREKQQQQQLKEQNCVRLNQEKTTSMDFDCSPTEYISSFKSGQLVEEESLIDHTTSNVSEKQIGENLFGCSDELFGKPSSQLLSPKKEIGGHKCDSPKNDDASDFYMHSKNIVAAIDPTYSNKASSFQAALKLDVDKDKTSRSRDYDSVETDTDVFLPVQGQKRGTVKNNLKKKKSQSQCLQQ